MNILSTSAGDGNLTVTVNADGSFFSALYDPIGDIPQADTTFQSEVAIRTGDSGPRTFLSGSGNLDFTSSSQTSADSTFNIQGLDFQLTQSVSETFQDSDRTGSLLTQTYNIANSSTESVTFELIRYLDGDLFFDGSLIDGGGLLMRGQQEILFETDSAGEPDTSTTFVGITAEGGITNLPGRLEIDSFAGLRSRILAGDSLDDLITGDGADPDEFIDAGAGYDITLALRNVFILDPGQSTIYTTNTIFGSGAPEDVPIGNNFPVADDDNASTLEGESVTINVLNNDVDPDGDSITITSVTNASNGLVLDNGDGTVTYTPNLGFNGTDTFSYSITDGINADTATVTVEVDSINIGGNINAENDNATTKQGCGVAVDVLSNDIGSTGNQLGISSISSPANGMILDNGDGTITYDPNRGFSGLDSFTYSITDGNGGTDTATVNVNVIAASSTRPSNGDDVITGTNGIDVRSGKAGDDVIYGLGSSDRLFGSSGDDKLYGDNGSDKLFGGSGDDLLIGGNQRDTLQGDAGNDTLTAGVGTDVFAFKNIGDGIDEITDFVVGEDKIRFHKGKFRSGLRNRLSQDQFVLGSTSVDAASRFIYDGSTGALFFDADGTGAQAQVQLATLSTGLELSHADFEGRRFQQQIEGNT